MKTRSRRTFLKTGLALASSPPILLANDWQEIVKTDAAAAENVKKFLAAIAGGDLQIVQQMLAQDSDLVHGRDSNGKTGYAIALLAGYSEIANLLTKSGYKSDLHEAVEKLIRRDSRLVHSVATTGERAVEAGAHMGNKKIVELLLNEGAPYSLPTAVMMEDYQTAKKYLDQEPSRIHERGAHHNALLFYALFGQCKLDMLQLLLDRGAKVEQQNVMGTTALHLACRGGDADAVKLLIENGANVKRVGRNLEVENKHHFNLLEHPRSLAR